MKNEWSQHLKAATISSILNCLAVQPLELLKTRLQQPGQQKVIQICRRIVKDEGMGGFWRGIQPTLLRSALDPSLLSCWVEMSQELVFT